MTERVAPMWLFLSGLFLYAIFPATVLAWLEPDPVQDDELVLESKVVST